MIDLCDGSTGDQCYPAIGSKCRDRPLLQTGGSVATAQVVGARWRSISELRKTSGFAALCVGLAGKLPKFPWLQLQRLWRWGWFIVNGFGTIDRQSGRPLFRRHSLE